SGNARKAAIGFRWLPLFCRFLQMYVFHCGSEPAREGGVSVHIDIAWNIAFASRLAPTGDGG
ncbi:MAG: hypothetical protein ACJ8G8_16515, partial [Pseudomonas sp.]